MTSQTSARILADSVNEYGSRLTTLQVRFPRFILAEVNTHRVFSRNYRSSRAVPVAKLLKEVRDNPFMPSQFTRNQPGMQGGEPLSGDQLVRAERAWREAAMLAANAAEHLAELGVHKQYANRGIEPYLYVDGVISSTEWANFFELRCHADAQPEFQELAYAMRGAMECSEPKFLEMGEWHLPYVSEGDRCKYDPAFLCKLSAARCAWVSYRPFTDDETTSPESQVNRIYDKLITSKPMHSSPLEHQARPAPFNNWCANYHGWRQFRHIMESVR